MNTAHDGAHDSVEADAQSNTTYTNLGSDDTVTITLPTGFFSQMVFYGPIKKTPLQEFVEAVFDVQPPTPPVYRIKVNPDFYGTVTIANL